LLYVASATCRPNPNELELHFILFFNSIVLSPSLEIL
jgi:hypothetical protein